MTEKKKRIVALALIFAFFSLFLTLGVIISSEGCSGNKKIRLNKEYTIQTKDDSTFIYEIKNTDSKTTYYVYVRDADVTAYNSNGSILSVKKLILFSDKIVHGIKRHRERFL